MSKIIAIILLAFITCHWACESGDRWELIEEAKLIKATFFRSTFSSGAHWVLEFESGTIIKTYNRLDAVFVGKAYEIYYHKSGEYILKLKKEGKKEKP